MSLDVYQEVFCRMVASLAFRERVVERPDEVLNDLDLTERERRRLLAIASDPGMRVNTAIHRANRISPLDHTLPFTCFLLGPRLHVLFERYWSENPSENLQSPVECERFAAFLKGELESGRLVDPYVADVLEFERTCTELRFFTEEELREAASLREGLSPLVRIVAFRHDPVGCWSRSRTVRCRPPTYLRGSFICLSTAAQGRRSFACLMTRVWRRSLSWRSRERPWIDEQEFGLRYSGGNTSCRQSPTPKELRHKALGWRNQLPWGDHGAGFHNHEGLRLISPTMRKANGRQPIFGRAYGTTLPLLSQSHQ